MTVVAEKQTSHSFKLPHSSIAVANEFIALGVDTGRPITPMAIQKLAYFAHGWRLKVSGVPLVDEEFQAWRLGPVMSTVYHEFKRWRAEVVYEFGTDFEPELSDGEVIAMSIVEPRVLPEDTGVLGLIRETWRHYGSYNASTLSRITHEDGGAWDRVWKSTAVRNGLRYVGIPNWIIRDEFDLRADAAPKLYEAFVRAANGG